MQNGWASDSFLQLWWPQGSIPIPAMLQGHLRAGLSSPLERKEYKQHTHCSQLAWSLVAQGQGQVRLGGPEKKEKLDR